jgi:hypothetical protein
MLAFAVNCGSLSCSRGMTIIRVAQGRRMTAEGDPAYPDGFSDSRERGLCGFGYSAGFGVLHGARCLMALWQVSLTRASGLPCRQAAIAEWRNLGHLAAGGQPAPGEPGSQQGQAALVHRLGQAEPGFPALAEPTCHPAVARARRLQGGRRG